MLVGINPEIMNHLESGVGRILIRFWVGFTKWPGLARGERQVKLSQNGILKLAFREQKSLLGSTLVVFLKHGH